MNTSVTEGQRDKQPVVACLGSSSTTELAGYDWIRDLEARPGNASFRFFRLAEGGDLAYNGLQRVPDIINCHPDFVIVLITGNDVLTRVSTRLWWFVQLFKHPPTRPSPQWYHDNIQAIVRQLKQGTSATIGLCSQIPIGEAPNSTNPFQAEVNRYIVEYNEIIKNVAEEEGVGYVPIYERLHEQIMTFPGHAFTSFRFLPFYRDTFLRFALHKSIDEVAQRNGWKLHIDGVHLNSLGGKIVADTVQEFISG